MQKNRALRATAIIMFGWVGLRSSFLLLSPHAQTSAPFAQQAETALPITQPAIISSPSIPQRAMTKHIIRYAHAKSDARIAVVRISQTYPRADGITLPAQSAFTGSDLPSPLPKILDSSETQKELASSHPRRFLDLSVSAWAIVRPASSGQALATNGQLGASQAGIRIQQPFVRSGDRSLVTLNLRISTPLDQKLGGEAGIGLSTRPARNIPIELIAERRVALDRGGRSAFALIAAGGFDDMPIVKKVGMSGYAQTGMVGFARNDGFIDGALRVEQALLGRDRTALRIGAGLWGAAQPGVSRIDVGPILAVKQRLGAANLRISAEYRWRVTGQARPASGPALSIGTDF